MVQVKAMQKQLDKIGSSVNRIKNIPTIREKVLGINAARNEFQILLILISLHHQYRLSENYDLRLYHPN